MNSKYMQALFTVLAVSLFTVPQAAALSVNLTAPDTDYYSSSRNVTFSCNATDENLTNLTLFIWDSDNSTYFSATTGITGTFNETNWTVNDTIPGDYTWNCLAYDNESNTDWADNNFSLHVNLFNIFESSAEADSTRDLAIADLDNDGDLDYIAANPAIPNRVYLNNGTGNFSLFESSAESGQTFAIAIADLDNDGDPDYIAGNNFGQPNSIYLNNGTGSFSLYETVTVTSAQSTESIVIADFDNDGDLDFAEALTSGTSDLRTYMNNGTAHFTSWENKTSSNYYALAAGDVNGDGYTDMVAGGVDPQATRVYFNNGSGYFTTSSQLWGPTNMYTYTVSLGDLDNDGDLDLIEGNGNTPGNQPTRIFMNNGTGNFTLSQSIGNSDTRALLVEDFNNDGYLDILENNRQGNSYLLINNGTGMFTEFETLHSTDAFSAAAGDLDNDGDLDYITGNFLTTVNSVYKNTMDNNNYLKMYVEGNGASVPVNGIGTRIVVTNTTGDLISYREVMAADQSRGGTIQMHFGLMEGVTYTVNGSLTNGKVISCSVQAPKSFTVYQNGTATNGVSCFVVDFRPAVTASFPATGNVSDIQDVNFSCNATDDNMLDEMTLYIRNSSNDIYYQNTAAVTGVSNYTLWELNSLDPDSYLWSCVACDNSSQCTYRNSTIAILVSRKLLVKLVLNSSSSTVFIPGNEEKPSAYSDYIGSNPPSFYATSQTGNLVRGLVFSGKSPWILEAGSAGSDHYITIGQDIEKSSVFLVFTSGGWQTVDRKIGYIESGDFMKKIMPSFAYSFPGKYLYEIALEYAAISLSGTLMTRSGTSKLVVENNGTLSGKTSLLVRRSS